MSFSFMFQSSRSSGKRGFRPSRGFTLIEMMVSLVIFAAISGVVLLNYNGFNSRILLSNLTYDIALSIRQSQVFGIGVREYASETPPFGIFLIEDSTDGSTNHYVFYSDLGNPGDNAYADPTGTNCSNPECLDRYVLQKGNKVSSFCIWNGASSICSPDLPGPESLDSLSILFRRPNPDARFFAVCGGGACSIAAPDKATLTISDPSSSISKMITVLNTGQISVN